MDQCRPAIVETSLAFCNKPYMAQTIVALPLSDDGEQIDMIVSAHSFHSLNAMDQPIDPAALRQGARR